MAAKFQVGDRVCYAEDTQMIGTVKRVTESAGEFNLRWAYQVALEGRGTVSCYEKDLTLVHPATMPPSAVYFNYHIGQQVTLIDLKLTGRIIGMNVSPGGIQYQVVWWWDGQRHAEWLQPFEVQAWIK